MNADGVTAAQQRALKSVRCPWCHAAVGEDCTPVGSPRRRVTMLAGRAHDARWMAALGEPAPVLAQRVADRHSSTSDSTAC